jgi:hypothetical protein
MEVIRQAVAVILASQKKPRYLAVAGLQGASYQAAALML